MKKLIPFTNTAQTNLFKVAAEIEAISHDTHLLNFEIQGPVERILWPAPAVIESRQDELWKTTCLEAFLSSGNTATDSYLEINCSPNGNWNAYKFSSYRQGMVPAADVSVRLQERTGETQRVRFQIEIKGFNASEAVFHGLTAVIEFTNGEKSYWSLKHADANPNFHDKEGWESATTR
ncbi:DOMON-like domain-containing protein [Bdellovibrio sp. HCB117]|uniref:DOMON-like domain-containing protein n=1 Tax=Bdellovibrio sp. HCB117 TaxID=3394359 RepID=UPI0039B3FC43